MSFLKGWVGEQQIAALQVFALSPAQYRRFSDVFFKVNLRYTQIDHVIVSKFGVFVIETKNRTGWIFGQERDRYWTQLIFDSKTRFQNPLRQNYLHTKSVAEFCGIDHDKIHSVVVFCGDCTFKTKMPDNVVEMRHFIRHIKSKSQVLLSDAEIESACNRLETTKGGIPLLASLSHAQVIKNQRKRRDICRRCGGRLIPRTAHRGKMAGQRFIGCENYPQCRFTRKLASP